MDNSGSSDPSEPSPVADTQAPAPTTAPETPDYSSMSKEDINREYDKLRLSLIHISEPTRPY